VIRNAKAKGRRREWRSRDLLEAAGYRVTRAGASLGEWDLIGISKTDIVLVQVKSNAYPGTLERLAMIEFPVPANCRKLIHRWRDHARQPDVQEL
jgi:Holliday junction resolvase-like predicted endonuclease